MYMRPTIQPTGNEVFFGVDEIIVSKTDLQGRITYANQVFLRAAKLSEEEALGESHNLIRHPAMPRCVFKLLWDTIQSGKEIFAYVINMAKDGDHYWVLAHVTPTFGPDGSIVSYHSNRRVPDRDAVEKAQGLYETLLAEEQKYSSAQEATSAGERLLHQILAQKKLSYEEFVFTLDADA